MKSLVSGFESNKKIWRLISSPQRSTLLWNVNRSDNDLEQFRNFWNWNLSEVHFSFPHTAVDHTDHVAPQKFRSWGGGGLSRGARICVQQCFTLLLTWHMWLDWTKEKQTFCPSTMDIQQQYTRIQQQQKQKVDRRSKKKENITDVSAAFGVADDLGLQVSCFVVFHFHVSMLLLCLQQISFGI